MNNLCQLMVYKLYFACMEKLMHVEYICGGKEVDRTSLKDRSYIQFSKIMNWWCYLWRLVKCFLRKLHFFYSYSLEIPRLGWSQFSDHTSQIRRNFSKNSSFLKHQHPQKRELWQDGDQTAWIPTDHNKFA